MTVVAYSTCICSFVVAIIACIAYAVALGWSTREVKFRLEVDMESNVERVYDFMKDPLYLKLCHPHVTDVEVTDFQYEKEGDTVTKEHFKYAVSENVPIFGEMTVPVNSTADSASKTITHSCKIWSFDMTVTYTFEMISDGITRVEEKTVAVIPRLLSTFFKEQAIPPHKEILQNVQMLMLSDRDISHSDRDITL